MAHLAVKKTNLERENKKGKSGVCTRQPEGKKATELSATRAQHLEKNMHATQTFVRAFGTLNMLFLHCIKSFQARRTGNTKH